MPADDICVVHVASSAPSSPALGARFVLADAPVVEQLPAIGQPDLAIVVDPFTKAGEEAVLLAGWAARRVWFVVTHAPESRLGVELEMHRIAERIVVTEQTLGEHLPAGTPFEVVGGTLSSVLATLVDEASRS